MLSIVLPTIDEAPNLRALVPELLEIEEVTEIWVVDDGSTDGTQALIRSLADDDPRIHLIERRSNPGLTASIWEGIRASSSEFVAWMDADGSMTGRDLARLVAEGRRSGADLVVGTRFARDGRIKGQAEPGLRGRLAALTKLGDTSDPWYGVLLSWGLNAVVLPLMLGGSTHDYTSGFVVAKRAVLLELGLRGDHGEYCIDLMVRAMRNRYALVEVGYAIQPRRAGHSKTAESPLAYLKRGRQYLTTAWRLRRGSDRGSVG